MADLEANSDGGFQVGLVGSEFIPDPDKETVEIPIQVDKGEIKFETGTGGLPQLCCVKPTVA
jgi:hypothetical protein